MIKALRGGCGVWEGPGIYLTALQGKLQNLCAKCGQEAPAVEAPVRLDTGFRDLECLHLAGVDYVLRGVW